MKKIIISAIILIFSLGLSAQVDRSVAPKAGPTPEIKMGDAKEFTLKNGLKVILVEDHTLPVVSMQINFIHEPTMDEQLNATYEVYGSVWKTGTTTLTKDQINEKLDFIGASVFTANRTIGFNSLSKYTEDVFALTTDILLNPTFPQEELDKTVTQLLSGFEAAKTDQNSIMSNIKSATIYKGAHPYGMIVTEDDVDLITTEACWEHYNTYIKPNNAILVIVGDITLKEAKKLVKRNLDSWEPGQIPAPVYDSPQSPEGVQVVFSSKDASPQSNISVSYPVDYKVTDEDYIAASLANFILGGGGFQAKLMKNLREDKGYTYGAYSRLSANRLVGTFNAGSEVIANATDSALVEIAKEMNNMIEGNFTDEDLHLAKMTFKGSFSRSLEDASTISDFAYNLERHNLPEDFYKTYLQKIDAVTKEDVIRVAKKYFTPSNAYFFVVGDRSVIPALEKIDSDGVVVELDYKGDVVVREAISGDVTAESVINSFLDYSGGGQKIRTANEVTVKSAMAVQGMNIENESVMAYDPEFKFKISQKLGGQVISEVSYEDGKAKVVSPQGAQELPAEIAEKIVVQGYYILEAYITELGITPVLEGIDEVNGKKAYKIKFDFKGQISYRYYDIETGACLKSVATEQGQTQEVFYSEYKELVNGIKFPFIQTISVMGMQMENKVKEIIIK